MHIHKSIWLPFLLAAAIKTAQGSSTVALITVASIMVPMMGTIGFTGEIEKALVVLAIGAESAVFYFLYLIVTREVMREWH